MTPEQNTKNFERLNRELRVTLTGGYNTQLCITCANDWDDFVLKSDAYESLRNIEDKLLLHVHSGDIENMRDRLDDIKDLRDQQAQGRSVLKQLAIDWIDRTAS